MAEKSSKKRLKWLGILPALLLAAILALGFIFYLKPELALPLIQKTLEKNDITLTFDSLEVKADPPSAQFKKLKVTSKQGLDLELDTLDLKFRPSALWQGGYWFKQVTARDLFLKMEQNKSSPGPPDLSGLAWVFKAARASCQNINLDIKAGGSAFSLENGTLTTIPETTALAGITVLGKLSYAMDQMRVKTHIQGKGKITGANALAMDLDLTNLDLDLPWLKSPGRARAELKLTGKELNLPKLELHLDKADLNLPSRIVLKTQKAKLMAALGLDLKTNLLSLSLKQFDLPGLARGKGQLSTTSQNEIKGVITGTLLDTAGLLSTLQPLLPSQTRELALSGPLPVEFSWGEKPYTNGFALELRPSQTRFKGFGLDTALKGQLSLKGPWQGPVALKGNVSIKGNFTQHGLLIKGFELNTPLSGLAASPELLGFDLKIPQGKAFYHKKNLDLGAASLKGQIKKQNQDWQASDLVLICPKLGKFTGRLTFANEKLKAGLEGQALKLSRLLPLTTLFMDTPLKDWNPEGLIDLKAVFTRQGKSPKISLDLSAASLETASPDGVFMAQGLGGTLKANLSLSSSPLVELELKLNQGEALWKTIYLNLVQTPIYSKATSRISPKGDFKDTRLETRLQDMGVLKAKGDLMKQAKGTFSFNGGLNLEKLKINKIFKTFIKDPLADANPDLALLSPDGDADLELILSGSAKKADLKGSLRLKDFSLKLSQEATALKGLNLNLPLAYKWGEKIKRGSKNYPWGSLKIALLDLPGLKLANLDMPVRLRPNLLELGKGLSMPLFGGNLQLRKIKIKEPLSADYKGLLEARLDNLDLAELAPGLLQGSLQGAWRKARINTQEMAVRGSLKGTLYQGELLLSNLRVSRPFSPGREIGLNLKVRSMDLKGLSQALGAGIVTGRVDLDLNNLRLAYGQPIAFDLKVLSLPVPDVPQKVSIQAVNSISVVGTGSGLTGLGVDLFKTFMQEFPYEKIGFSCSLKNDVFSVRGLIKENGVEYLVKKPPFLGINVVNRNERNHISFKDMADRLKRVTEKK
ncbi:hypothetical protein [Dethiosulfatarculus sandiegensis]|uniref:AsmA-like C-terminal domain-containing protein n=1 Tax=Dethiosulfatarculus sandiegensis TaxID=1429043 RepID=A0A0D2J486_9BACT|nr:hypothetical protein [Dethiosulfatarculus sandiegensis]KIX12949.1 hypothetical protein X474_16775 [Dethiosulfatarculus sandiegensis]